MLVLVLFASWILQTQCLEVTNTSICADTCNGPSLTFSSDLSCSDDDYSTTANGVLFKNCLECEITSTAESGDTSTSQNNDIYWSLFNMKYTVEQCLFGDNGSTPNLPQCESVCAGLYTVLEASWFTTPPPQQYDYCSIANTAFPTYAKTCASCLLSTKGSVVLGNFLNTMQSACDTQPDASQGATIALQRELFNTATVGTATTSLVGTSSTSAATTSSITSTATTSEATAATTESGSTSISEATATPTSSSVTAPAQQTSSGSSGLSSGAAAGIGIGCGLGAIALAAGLGWWFLKRRRQRQQAPPVHNDLPSNDSKSDFVNVSSYQPPPYASPHAQQYAQQLASQEVHEMDTRQSRNLTNELDGRPVR